MAESETKQDDEPHAEEESAPGEADARENEVEAEDDARDAAAEDGVADEASNESVDSEDDAADDAGVADEASADEGADDSEHEGEADGEPDEVAPGAAAAETSRRQFLDTAILGGTVVVGAASAYPAVRFLEPVEGATATSATVARVDDFPAGTAKSARLGETPVLVLRDVEGTFRAYVAVCPHLQCVVHYARQRREIACACHGGRFSLTGSPKGGPPKQPLEVLRVNVVAGNVVVTRA
jgi:cytochrome b6-f complex iron-sulfur subunit